MTSKVKVTILTSDLIGSILNGKEVQSSSFVITFY